MLKCQDVLKVNFKNIYYLFFPSRNFRFSQKNAFFLYLNQANSDLLLSSRIFTQKKRIKVPLLQYKNKNSIGLRLLFFEYLELKIGLDELSTWPFSQLPAYVASGQLYRKCRNLLTCISNCFWYGSLGLKAKLAKLHVPKVRISQTLCS